MLYSGSDLTQEAMHQSAVAFLIAADSPYCERCCRSADFGVARDGDGRTTGDIPVTGRRRHAPAIMASFDR